MEVRFKSWDKKDKEWIDDFAVTSDGDITFGSYPEGGFWTDENGKYELVQWTGLKDKNGVDIYEGDIIEMFYDKWEVRFGDFDAEGNDFYSNHVKGGFYAFNKKDKETYTLLDGCEVIGNIYEGVKNGSTRL